MHNYFAKNKIKSDVTRKTTAVIEVSFGRTPSSILDLLLPKNVSAPPAIVPVKPADLLSWSKTVITRTIAIIIWIITKANIIISSY